VSQAKTTSDVVGRNAVEGVDPTADAQVTKVGTDSVRVQTSKLKDDSKNAAVVTALAKAYGVSESQVSSTFIGPSWGADISKKALEGLIAFLILVSLVIAFYFRTWTMAVAGIVALLHDLLITAGVYALVGFEVSPASVIGFLTILGYSLYDTVVVFDKVRENTQNLTATAKSTYSEAANLAVNQTLVRSINTSVVALLPIASILVIGTILVGAGTLEDLALALFVGHRDRHLLLHLHCDATPGRPARAPAGDEVAAQPGAQAPGGSGGSDRVAQGSSQPGRGGGWRGAARRGGRTATARHPPASGRSSGSRNQPKRGQEETSGKRR